MHFQKFYTFWSGHLAIFIMTLTYYFGLLFNFYSKETLP